jgi:hypothetical protein
MIRFLMSALVMMAFCFVVPGCGIQDQMQESVKKSIPDGAGLVKTLAESPGAKNLIVQGGAQAINPKLVGEFEGYWVVGIKGRASYGVEGVGGQANISGTAPQGMQLPASQPASQPAP